MTKRRFLFTAGERLRGLRELMGLSRPAFAEIVGIKPKRLENIENGWQKMHDEDPDFYVIPTDEYPPFNKKLTVCGITLIGNDKITDEFMRKVGRVIQAMFSPEGDHIDRELQEEMITNMYRYRTSITKYYG